MYKYYIVEVDIGGKQDFIYSSNNLKEIIGASKIIEFVSEYLGKEILECYGFDKNYFNFDFVGDDSNGNILYSAGGNSTYIFKEEVEARRFINIFSTMVLKGFPHLELNMTYDVFDFEKEIYSEFYTRLLYKLNSKRNNRLLKDISFGLHRDCPFSGKPAGTEIPREHEDDLGKIVSLESYINKMFSHFEMYKDELRNHLDIRVDNGESLFSMYDRNYKNSYIENFYSRDKIDDLLSNMKVLSSIPEEYTDEILNLVMRTTDINRFMEKLDKQYTSVICMDGNGMGKLFEDIKKAVYKLKIDNILKNSAFIKLRRAISEKIQKIYTGAFSKSITVIAEDEIRKIINAEKNIQLKNISEYEKLVEIKEYIKKETDLLKLRPIILAGDDINIISYGKISLEFARIFNENLIKNDIKLDRDSWREVFDDYDDNISEYKNVSEVLEDTKLGLGIGISIANKKYPYHRIVNIAQECETNAKNRLREISSKSSSHSKITGSLIDWKIVRGEYDSTYAGIEKNSSGNRPYCLHLEDAYSGERLVEDDFKESIVVSYNTLRNQLESIQESDKKSILKGYLSKTKESPEESIRYLRKHQFDENGDENLLSDAVELMDLFQRIDGGVNNENR